MTGETEGALNPGCVDLQMAPDLLTPEELINYGKILDHRPVRLRGQTLGMALAGVLKTQMTGLMGDGSGGRLGELERRMERHEQNWQRAKGFLAAFSVLLTVVEVAVSAWHRH